MREVGWEGEDRSEGKIANDIPADTGAFDADSDFAGFKRFTAFDFFEGGAGFGDPEFVLRVGVDADVGLGDGLGGLDGGHGGALSDSGGEEGRRRGRRGGGEGRFGDGGEAGGGGV